MAKSYHRPKWHRSDQLAPALPPWLIRWSQAARRKVLSEDTSPLPSPEDPDNSWESELDEWLFEHDYKFEPDRDEPQDNDWAYPYDYE